MPQLTPTQLALRQAAIASRVILLCSREIRAAYAHQSNVGRLFQEIFVAMAVQLNDQRRKRPASISALARAAGLPRSNVHRAVERLVRRGVMRKSAGGYTLDDGPGVLLAVDRRHLRRIVAAITAGADDLRNPQKNIWH